MGKALYRKYRPKKLSEIVGQEHITTTLKNAIKNNSISHAYLFTGPRGTGKTSIARILAHEVNNLPYDDDRSHLDIIEIDAASNRRIDEIREIRERVHNTPTSTKYKVYIIDEVHMLTREAFNALLKTLEEPPAHAIFILATTEAHKLPETIISRTQRFTFKPIETHKVAQHLRTIAKSENIDIDDGALELIAKHGDGSFRDSISLLDQIASSGKNISENNVIEVLGIAPNAVITQLKKVVSEGAAKEVVKLLDELSEQGFHPGQIAKQLSAQLRHDLLDGEWSFEPSAFTSILEKLLTVPTAHDPASALEITLIGAALENTKTKQSLDLRKTSHSTGLAKSESEDHSLDLRKIARSQAKSARADSGLTEGEVAALVTSKEGRPLPLEISWSGDAEISHKSSLAPPATLPVSHKKTPKNHTKKTTSQQTTTIQKQEPQKILSDKNIESAEVGQSGNEKTLHESNIWPAALVAIKNKHNTLYSLARMASAELNDDVLTLSFGFPFHQKQLNESKNKATIESILYEQTGKKISINCIVVKNMDVQSAIDKPVIKAPSTALGTISNIFGGAEVLE
ncbi:DNA polymerase III subunit gamma/tau [Candidatus Saccharibacteria bacterium]|nr:DNA polymerase III subunit gamma/tau [Candidatus Saccharibacteria bacterium]MBI3337984.1 DNA polymerase III subunit gamma/tau [Candidatus Saccharibacteria bacterium]